MNEFELIAKTFMGLEPVLAKELTQLGANNVQIGRRMVSFTGDKEMMYRANFQLHTAIRILKPIAKFKARSADEVYEEVKKIDWSKYIEKGKTFSVDSVVYSEEFRNSRFVTYKVKDAIVDQFRENTGTRPNISVSNPDIRLNIHIAEADATLSLDSSGESLHRRGYRQESVEAPLNEVLAAGMILMTGWRGETDFIDPMCGSGTLLVEAALIAHNMSPGIFRKEFAFEKWPDFDAELFDTIYNDDTQEREFKKRLDEEEENAESDIRSFKFHSIERRKQNDDRRGGNERKSRDRFDRDDKDFKGKGFKGKGFSDKGGKSFGKGSRYGKSDRKRSNRDFDNED